MITHSITPNTPDWHKFRSEHFGASEIPAVLGISPYKTRSQLLHEKATGIVPDVDAGTQRLFDEGHRSEALARAHIEAILGVELYPCIGSDGGTLSASFDGLDEDCLVCWEHKSLNASLRGITNAADLPEHYRAQMEQQLMVSGAPGCYFSATRWDGDVLAEEVQLKYLPDMALRERIRAAWEQFHRDVSTYVQPEVIPEVVAAPIKDLPAITYKMDGMHLSTNLRNDVKPAILALVEQSKRKLETDQDFADLDALCKKFKQAEEQCALVQSQAVGEIKDVDAFCRDLKELSEIMRQARIAGEKAVTSEKDARKLAILTKAKAEFSAHLVALEAEIKPITISMPTITDFAGSMKGLKKLSAMQEAVDNALRDGKMLADSAAKDIRAKLAWCKEHAAGMSMLFPDLQQIIVKPMDDFTLTITSRIDKHKADEAAKIERIRAEEQVKAEAAAKAKVESEARAKAEQEAAARLKEQQEAADEIKAREAEHGAPQERGRGDVQLASKPAVTQRFPPAGTIVPDAFIPTSEQIVEAVASVFEVDNGTALTWLQHADFTSREFA